MANEEFNLKNDLEIGALDWVANLFVIVLSIVVIEEYLRMSFKNHKKRKPL